MKLNLKKLKYDKILLIVFYHNYNILNIILFNP